MAITGPLLSAQATPAVPTKTASVANTRIESNPDRLATVIESGAARVKAGGETHGKPNVEAFMLRQFPGDRGAKKLTQSAASVVQEKAVSAIVRRPIAIVTSPTAPCRPRLAQVSQRAESASGTAITVDKNPIPIIEPMPNSAT
jgi:hypothetical protein